MARHEHEELLVPSSARVDPCNVVVQARSNTRSLVAHARVARIRRGWPDGVRQDSFGNVFVLTVLLSSAFGRLRVHGASSLAFRIHAAGDHCRNEGAEKLL